VHGDTNFNYTYSNTTKQALIWTGVTKIKTCWRKTRNLQFLPASIYTITATRVCLGTGWERFKEKRTIASVSFGAERKFAFKHKDSKETYQKFLARKLTANERRDPLIGCTAYLLLLASLLLEWTLLFEQLSWNKQLHVRINRQYH
jgi:hypothetical protein